MRKQYHVILTPQERADLQALVAAGIAPSRMLTHARILLKADSGPEGPAWTDEAIVDALDVGCSTVARVRQRFVRGGLGLALERQPPLQPPVPRKLDGVKEAQLIALTCSAPPAGRDRWTLQLLADKMVALGHVESLSYETVRRTLKKTNSSRG
jgi:Homeodomain-like domain